MAACPVQGSQFSDTVASWAKTQDNAGLPAEIAALEKKTPNLEKNFPLDWEIRKKELFIVWSAARACDFNLERMQREFPAVCKLTPVIVLAEKKEGRSHLLIHSANGSGEGNLLILASGDGEVPQLHEYEENFDEPKWKGTWLDRRSFSQFKVEERDGQQYAVGLSYYHPFPGENKWPKYLLWVEIRGNQLIPNRAECYLLPSDEKEIKPEYLKETRSLFPD